MTAAGWDNDAYMLDEYEPEEKARSTRPSSSPCSRSSRSRPTPSTRRWSSAGGLYVLGTERHDSRRIDNQLRGRSGRQGDPGESRFYLSLEDDLMRLFASDRIARMMERLEDPRRRPDRSQDRVQGDRARARRRSRRMNFEIRKNVLKYDEVMDKQRQVIYDERRKILEGEDIHDESDRPRHRRHRERGRREREPRSRSRRVGLGAAVHPGARDLSDAISKSRTSIPRPSSTRRWWKPSSTTP